MGCTSDMHGLRACKSSFPVSLAAPCSKPLKGSQAEWKKRQMALMAKMDGTDAAVNVGSGLQATSPHEQYVRGWPVLFHVIFLASTCREGGLVVMAQPPVCILFSSFIQRCSSWITGLSSSECTSTRFGVTFIRSDSCYARTELVGFWIGKA